MYGHYLDSASNKYLKKKRISDSWENLNTKACVDIKMSIFPPKKQNKFLYVKISSSDILRDIYS